MEPRKSSVHLSTADFARELSESGLFSPPELNATIDAVSGDSTVLTGGDLAQRLVAAGWLTSFQAEALLEQRPHEVMIGQYEVLERLGAGAMGTVYKARHRRMKRLVAIKVLSRALANSAFISRFQREVETLAQLTHPNIIMAFDADVDEVGHYLVMEFVDGRDLATIVQQHGQLSLAHALEATAQAARGLEYAHRKNIVHRDVKPANIMWDASGVIKVADLGLARLEIAHRASQTSVTQAGSIVGTADYMAPEQALDSTSIDHRVDIYSLGCTLYFLLTGQTPYQADSIMATLLKHRDAPIPSVRDLRPDAPAVLDQLLTSMLAKLPAQRIDSMAEVGSVLEGVQADLELVPAVAAVTQPRPLSDLTVILVEPSRTQAAIVRKYLQELGIEKVRTTESGVQARELAVRHGCDVFLSSLHLADMTGMQLASQVRADDACSAMGFVLTTSSSAADDLAMLRTLPRTALVLKPFDAQKLAAALVEATRGLIADPS